MSWKETEKSMKKHQPPPLPKGLKGMDFLAKWMDTKFVIPGTNFRFGLDGLLGLVPGIGDLSTFVISGYLVLVMARNGASGYVVARMLFNIVLDAALGSIPMVGDLFDFVHKANIKNMKIAQQYYTEGRYRGGSWKVILPVAIVLLLILLGIAWLIYRLFSAIFSYL